MIFWFSGTGNSRLVAERIAEGLGETSIRIDGRFDEAVAGLSPQERIVWVCPVYGWRVPPVVERAVSSLSDNVGSKAAHWLVVTCGDDVGETPRYWRQLVESRGWSVAGIYSVRMPNTYVFLPGFDVDSPEDASRKLADAPGRVDSIIRSIKADEKELVWVRPGMFPALKSRVLCPPFRRILMNPSRFKVDSSRCVGCGNCMTACPMNNITLDSGRHPVWGDNCAFCTACYQVCSHSAIRCGRWSHGKGRYIAPARFPD